MKTVYAFPGALVHAWLKFLSCPPGGIEYTYALNVAKAIMAKRTFCNLR